MLLLVHIDSVSCVEAGSHLIPAAVAKSVQPDPKLDHNDNVYSCVRDEAHADTQIHQALYHASCGAADCCGTAQHTRKPAISAANSIAELQTAAKQAAQLCRPSVELCSCRRRDSRWHASSCAGAGQEGARHANAAAAPQDTARPPRAKTEAWQCTSSE